VVDPHQVAIGDVQLRRVVHMHQGVLARREPGPWDPYIVYSELGEAGIGQRLGELDIEQLRNMIAEHGMDTDRLAMKWRDPEREWSLASLTV
jgi:hypothetical protein